MEKEQCAPKKVLILLGSPRKNGNSTFLAEKTAAGAKHVGAEVETIYLHGLKINPCSGCDACLKENATGCIVQDDMQGIYPKIRTADSIVFASPIYWFNYSAQLKTCIDRTYCMQGNNRFGLTDKNIGIILTYADVDVFASGGVNALRSLQDMCTFVRAHIVGVVHGSAEKPGEIRRNSVLEQKAFELGELLGKTQ